MFLSEIFALQDLNDPEDMWWWIRKTEYVYIPVK